MGLFKGIKDLASVTKQAKQLQEQQQVQAGYKPGMRGSMAQMGDMVGELNDTLKELNAEAADGTPIGSLGVPAPAVTPAPAAGGDVVTRLERLAQLRDSGALTDAEFQQQKARILSS